MRVVLQRVKKAKVTVDEKITGEIKKGYLLLIGIGPDDTEETVEKMLDKIEKLRLFEDEAGKMNLNIHDVNGGMLAVSQFTLYADCKKGTRPGFSGAANPEKANELYEYFIKISKDKFSQYGTGVFGADMQVELINDGPVTICLEID